MLKRLGLYKKLIGVGVAIFAISVGLVAIGAPYWIMDKLASQDEWNEEGHKFEATIEITSTGFVPATLSVHKDTRVYFENHDTTKHGIMSNPGSSGIKEFGAVAIGESEGYAYSFHKGGSFSFHDPANPTSNGEIVVK